MNEAKLTCSGHYYVAFGKSTPVCFVGFDCTGSAECLVAHSIHGWRQGEVIVTDGSKLIPPVFQNARTEARVPPSPSVAGSVSRTCLTCGRQTCDRQPEDRDPADCKDWKPKPNKALTDSESNKAQPAPERNV